MKKAYMSTVFALVFCLAAAQAGAAVQEWELVDPKGITITEPVSVLAHDFDTLNGKTVVLRWNAKANGDHFLNRLAEHLVDKFPQINLVKAYEVNPDTFLTTIHRTPLGAKGTRDFVEMIQAMRPDLVISAQAD